MSVCEHMCPSIDSSESSSQKSPEEKLNLQNELIWGLKYRHYKENEKRKPIMQIHSPIDIPFEICRADLMLNKKKGKHHVHEQASRTAGNKGEGEGTGKPIAGKSKSKKRKRGMEKPSLLDRSVWSQSKYMDFLSIPNPKYDEPKLKKYKKRCELEPCPPRFVQLAVPNKRRVFANWKDYARFLPAEMLMRYEEILHTDQNLEPREARYYYKKLDRERRKKLKKKKQLEKKKKLQKEKDSNWLKAQVDMLAKDIVDYIQDEPLFTLNYKQLLLSDGILERLEKTNIMKKPSRKTKNHFKKTVIEASDKFAIWIDTLTRFVDVQAVESDEDVPPLSISSLAEEGEGEGSSEYESSSEEELRDSQLFGEVEATWGEEAGDFDESGVKEVAESIIKDIFKFDEEEGATDFDEIFQGLDGDLLEKLIKILSNCSEDFLHSNIDDSKMPEVRYLDVLNKLKELRDGIMPEVEGKPFLEQIMIDWALKNEPDEVNDALLKKIHEVACLLGDWLYTGKHEHKDDDWDKLHPPGGEGGIGFGGEDLEGQGQGGTRGEDEGEYGGEGEGQQGGVSGGEEAGVTIDEGAIFSGDENLFEGEGGISEGDKVPSGETLMGGIPSVLDEAEGGITTPGETVFSDLEGEEGIGAVSEFVPEKEGEEGEKEEGVDVLYPPPTVTEIEGEGLDGKIIKGHKPSKVFEHSPDTVCCLSLKTWAVWLLEITHNAHNWTQWMSCVIQKIKEYASIVRGDVKLPSGETQVLRKAEWRKFIKETEEHVVAWRQYSAHVKDLSQSIIDTFHGKQVNCCPKCLQDHLIKNVVVAHDTLQALTEAISCAAYWQRSLDALVEKTCGLTKEEKADDDLDVSSEESDNDVDLEELENKGEESGESIYEIEGIESNINNKDTKDQ